MNSKDLILAFGVAAVTYVLLRNRNEDEVTEKTNENNLNDNLGNDLDSEVESIFGCTNPLALNYNSDATVDDGSCNVLDESEEIVVEEDKVDDFEFTGEGDQDILFNDDSQVHINNNDGFIPDNRKKFS